MAGELAARVRAKHPGVYDDLSDADLEQRVLAKYPQYKDLVKEAPPTWGSMVREQVRDPIARAIPAPVKKAWKIAGELKGPFGLTGQDALIGGPLGGAAIGTAMKLFSRAKPAVQAAKAASSSIPAVKPRVTSQDFLRGMKQLNEVRANPPKAWPASKSSRAMSNIPGLTGSDVEYLTLKGHQVGPQPTPEALRALIEGRVLRTAAHRTGAEKGGADVLARMKGEGGAISPEMLKDIGRVANQVRVGSMLSGAAIPKNILGGAQAIGSAAIEGGSMAPIREALRVPTNLKTAVRAFKEGANPSGMSGYGGVNIPGRVIGAIDQTATDVLQRAQHPQREIERLLLTSRNDAFKHMGMDNVAGRALLPFQRTQANVLKEGVSSGNWDSPRKVALSLGVMGGGAKAGQEITESKLTPAQKTLSLGLLAAAMGPRAVPGMIAAGMGGAGSMATRGLTPIPEWTFPSSLPKAATTMTGMTPGFIRVKETLEEQPKSRRRRRR